MKILYFARGQSPHDLRFLQALAVSGHDVAVLCLDAKVEKPWPEGVSVLAWPKPVPDFSWFNAPKISRLFQQVIRQYQPDMVHAGPIQITGFIAALSGFRPLVNMSWGSDILMDARKNPLWECVTRFTLKRTTVLAADCQTVVDAARGLGCGAPARIFPWGVDLEHFTPTGGQSIREKLGWQQNTVFLCNRTMEKLYGVDIVARAFVKAAVDAPNIRLLLYGRGSQEQAIRELLTEAGVQDNVHFGGYAGLDTLPDVYRSADFYVSASHSDGSSVSLMEALACGKPVLVSDIPSNREWVRPGSEGWLFRDGDASQLADQMKDAAGLKDANQLSRNARKRAEERADWKKNFQILLTAYNDAVEISRKRIS
jgi:glycosyltransferase involved in cell wall biosynthesis